MKKVLLTLLLTLAINTPTFASNISGVVSYLFISEQEVFILVSGAGSCYSYTGDSLNNGGTLIHNNRRNITNESVPALVNSYNTGASINAECRSVGSGNVIIVY